MDNKTFAHKCFYSEGESIRHGSMSKSSDGYLYSYKEPVGFISEKFNIVILTGHYHSITTSKHVSHYDMASPYRIFKLPIYISEILHKLNTRRQLYNKIVAQFISETDSAVKVYKNYKVISSKDKKEYLKSLATLEKLKTVLIGETHNSKKIQEKLDFYKEFFKIKERVNKDGVCIRTVPFVEKPEDERFKIAISGLKSAYKKWILKSRLNIDIKDLFDDNVKNLAKNVDICGLITDLSKKIYNYQPMFKRLSLDSFLANSCYNTNVITSAIKKLIIAKEPEMNKFNGLAFMYFDPSSSDVIKTSNFIKIDKNIVVERFMSLWLNPLFNREKAEGLSVGSYKIQTVNDKYVRIGCHVFPTFVLDNFADYLLNKKFFTV